MSGSGKCCEEKCTNRMESEKKSSSDKAVFSKGITF
jgi:hypothetical protein